jgi:hypothetical protein
MDWNELRGSRYMRWIPVLLVLHGIRAARRQIAIPVCMLAGVMLLPLVAGAIAGDGDEVTLDAYQQGILQAHPEWPPDVRAAVLAGIICAGMPADMVRVAWGHPTRTSSNERPGQHETWYYDGRPSAVERLAGWEMNNVGSSQWTVSFINGQVVAWTD